MNNTQSIIVYRNPVEQQFWESGIIVPLGACLITFVLVMLAVMKVIELTKGSWYATTRVWPTYVAATVAAIIAVLVFVQLSI